MMPQYLSVAGYAAGPPPATIVVVVGAATYISLGVAHSNNLWTRLVDLYPIGPKVATAWATSYGRMGGWCEGSLALAE